MVNRGNERYFDYFINILLILLAVISVFPCCMCSPYPLHPYSEVLRNGGFVLIPRRITLRPIRRCLEWMLFPAPSS